MAKGRHVRNLWLTLVALIPSLALAIPSVTINNPTTGGKIGGTAKITFTLSGGVGTMNLVVEVKSTNQAVGYTQVSTGSQTNGTVNTTWNTDAGGFPDDSDWEIRVTATDTVPSSGQNSVTSLIVNNATYIKLTNPTDTATVGGLVRAKGQAGDGWTLRWDGTSNAASGSAGSINADLNSTVLSDGAHTVVLTVTNSFGDQSTITRSLTVKNVTNPVVRLTAPTEGAGLKGTISIKGDSHHPDAGATTTVTTDLGANLFTGVGSNQTIDLTWDTVALGVPDGSRALTLLLVDASGNENRVIRNFTLDNIGPAVNFAITPISSGFVKGTVNIDGTINETNLDHYNVTVDGGTSGLTPSTGTTTTIASTWNTTIYSDGSHTVKVTAFDKAGNQGSAQVTVTSDNTKPVVNLTAPTAGTTVSGGSITVTGTATDANFDHWDLTVDGGTSGLGTATSTQTTVNSTIDTSVLSEGSHNLKLSGTDKAGNVAETSVTFSIDKTGPTIVLTAPLADAFVKGITDITGTVTDSNLDKWTVRIDGSVDIPSNTGTSSNLTVSWDTRAKTGSNRTFPDGPHTIDVRAQDKAGNVATLSRSVNVDNTAPVIQNVKPLKDDFVSGTVSITGEVIESNLDNWKVQVDGGDLASNTGNTSAISVDWDTTGYSEGNHTITITATDKAGNIATQSVSVQIDRTAPTLTILYPFKSQKIPPFSNMLVIVDVKDLSDKSLDPAKITAVIRDSHNNVVAKVDFLSSAALTNGTGIRWKGQVNVGKGPGKSNTAYTVEVTATDKAGNGPTTAKKQFFVSF